MNIQTPKGWRKGQTIFNFLWWLHDEKGLPVEPLAKGRMADPFNISDEKLDELWAEYLSTFNT